MTDKNKKTAKTEPAEGEDPLIFAKNYSTYCKQIGVTVNKSIMNTLQDPEKVPVEQIIINGAETDEYPQANIRALMTALLGCATGMKGGPYKKLKHLRIWKSSIGDEGVASIAEILRLGGAEIKLLYLELMEIQITSLGAQALGTSLSKGNNMSLLTLKLDYNPTLGSEGCMALCRGLRTNSTLKQLHLNYCNITVDAATDIANLLSNIRSGLEVLSLGGNMLTGKGLEIICTTGLLQNTVLTKLNLSDNRIDQSAEDMVGLTSLRDVLMTSDCAITSLNLLYNRIGEEGGRILLPVKENNKKITDFLVDISIPMPLFEKLYTEGGGGKKKKGGGGKKKKAK